MNPMIKNIIFDWGGVLLDLDTEGCVRRFEQAGATSIREYVTGTNEGGFFHLYECGMISTPEFRDRVRELCGKPLTDKEIDEIWNSELLSIPEYKLHLLRKLSSHYHLYLLSNTNELHWNHGSSYAFESRGEQFMDCFTGIFLSHELKLAKPDPEIFREVLKRAGLKAEETLFVDDAKKNCEAAAAVGIHPVYYVPGEDLGLCFE